MIGFRRVRPLGQAGSRAACDDRVFFDWRVTSASASLASGSLSRLSRTADRSAAHSASPEVRSKIMVKSDDRRQALLDRLADYVLAEGLGAASLRPLAAAAGISDRMLLYYFKDKSEIITAVLERIAARLVGRLSKRPNAQPMPLDELSAALIQFLTTPPMRPYMRVWLEIVALAARGDAFYRATGEQIARGFLAWGAAQLDSPTPQRREADAAKLLVRVEGMLVLQSVGLDDVCRKAL